MSELSWLLHSTSRSSHSSMDRSKSVKHTIDKSIQRMNLVRDKTTQSSNHSLDEKRFTFILWIIYRTIMFYIRCVWNSWIKCSMTGGCHRYSCIWCVFSLKCDMTWTWSSYYTWDGIIILVHYIMNKKLISYHWNLCYYQ